MKTLQGKAFWRRKRAVLENQLLHVENRLEIASERKKTETLWAYACNGFSEIHPKIDPKSTQMEKSENRSGATPVMVSAVFVRNSAQVATENKRSGATPVVVPAIVRGHRESDPVRLENYQTHFWSV